MFKKALARGASMRAGTKPVPTAALAATQSRGFRSDLFGTDIFRWQKKDDLALERAMQYVEPRKETIKVAVTGSSGNIGSALMFRLASGEMFGKDQRVQINAFDINPMIEKVKGVAMELYDCSFPTLEGVLVTDNIERAFHDVDVVLAVGSMPRGPGMERGDLLRKNGEIFVTQGRALRAARDCVKVIVVGNPANTNCLIMANNAPGIPLENFTAMSRLDHDRGLAQIAKKAKCGVTDIEDFCVWGNHSPTMFPDLTYARIGGRSAMEILRERNPGEDMDAWYRSEFIPTVQQRGAAIIKARGSSSAASAANACLMHARSWELGSDKWVSKCIPSTGDYGIKEGLIFSFPVKCQDGKYEVVRGLPELTDFQREMLAKTEAELVSERDAVADFLP
jgi:malate dehydrogenase